MELTEAVRDLTLVLRQRDLVNESPVRGSSSLEDRQRTASALWELVEESGSIPGAPTGFLVRDALFSFEEGPPDTPQFCVDAAKRHLTFSRFSSEDRARAAFGAGHWARAFWVSRSPYRSTYRPTLPPVHWVLRKGDGFDLIRVSSQRDCQQLERDFPDIVFIEKLPSLTELHIFCAGAKSPVPPLWKWNGISSR